MRILQIFNRYLQFGGEEGSVYQIGDALQELHDVEYFLTSTDAWLARHGKNRLSLLAASFYNGSALGRLRRYQTVGKFDVWQIHNVFPAMSPAVYSEAFRRDIPVIQYLHNYRLSCVNGFFLNHGKSCTRCINGNFLPAFQTACWRDSRLQSGAMGLVLARARALGIFQKVNRWIAISERQKELHVQMGIPAERITVVPHFMDLTAPPLPPSHEPILLFVGRLSAEKGVSALLKAWALLKTKNAELWIVGDGPEREALERESAKLGLSGVTFRGFVPAKEQTPIWRRALAGLVPSIWEEPFGKVVLEAWAQGRPVIGHRMGALPELIQPGETGELADPDSPEDLAAGMDRILSNPQRAGEMGQNGANLVRRQYNRTTWLQKISGVYESVRAR